MRARRRWPIALGLLLLLIVLSSAVAYIALNAPNQATAAAEAALQSDAEVIVSGVPGQDWQVFRPAGGTAEVGFILYPGGFVEATAYAPLAHDIARQGYLVVLDPMPLNLAFLNAESADAIIAAFPDIESWAIGGHSLGGAMAAQYAADNPDAVDGLALWAAYPAQSVDLSERALSVVSIYGDADGVASPAEVTGAAGRLPPDTRFVLLAGGNHTQFGDYGTGLQRGDNPATLDRDAQRAQIVAATADLLASLARSDGT